ncbi:hypothetical protein CYMTET_23085 [Cymbomonas tetramitiformis]|uniref:Uncharacterized protein n=1 Tax=Cymbomonas tetramitiformis TaxID=36881 RepID=A0AAE0FYM7_9CHLO|nr:hypothetical protein CYMTET_23085 [Cymbomonas tetramitiformis]
MVGTRQRDYESKLAESSATLSAKEQEIKLLQARLDELQQNESQGQAKARADVGLLGQLCLELMGRCAEAERSTALQDAVRTDSHHKLIAASVDIIDRWGVATEDWVESNTAARDCILADARAPVTQATSEDSLSNDEAVKDLNSTAPARLHNEPSVHSPAINVDIPTQQSISHRGLGMDATPTQGPSTPPVDTRAPSPQHQSLRNSGTDALPPQHPSPRNSGRDAAPLGSPSPHPSPSPPAAASRASLTPRSLHQSVPLQTPTPTSTTVTLNPHLTPPLKSPLVDPARPQGGYKGSLRPRSAREMLSHHSLSSLSPRRLSQISTPIGQSERLGQSEGIVHFTYGGSPAGPATTSPPRVCRPGGSSREMTSPAMSRRLHGGQGNGSTTGHLKRGFICRDAQHMDLITGDSPGSASPIDPAVFLRSLRQSQANQSGRRTGRSGGRAETPGAEAGEHTTRCFGGGGNFYMAPRAGTLGGTQSSPPPSRARRHVALELPLRELPRHGAPASRAAQMSAVGAAWQRTAQHHVHSFEHALVLIQRFNVEGASPQLQRGDPLTDSARVHIEHNRPCGVPARLVADFWELEFSTEVDFVPCPPAPPSPSTSSRISKRNADEFPDKPPWYDLKEYSGGEAHRCEVCKTLSK